MDQSLSWDASSSSHSQKNSPHFVDPKNLLLRSQQSTTCRYVTVFTAVHNFPVCYCVHSSPQLAGMLLCSQQSTTCWYVTAFTAVHNLRVCYCAHSSPHLGGTLLHSQQSTPCRYVTAFTAVHNLPVSSATLIQTRISHPIPFKIHCNIIIPSSPRFLSCLITPDFPTKTHYAFLFPSLPIAPSLIWSPWGTPIVKPLVM